MAEAVSRSSALAHKTVIAIFALIILEGYVVLSSELLAIRLGVPFVGSGTDTVSVIIAAVLMPLAFGYYYGGRFKAGQHFDLLSFGPRYISIRDKLILNMIYAMIFLLPALSYIFLDWFFGTAFDIHFTHRVGLTALYAALFIAPPVYLLGQTIPLASNYFSQEKLSRITGKILFFSTLGSFMGAVFSTIVLMATIGVHNTAALNFVILAGLITLLSKPRDIMRTAIIWIVAIGGFLANSDWAMREHRIIENNQYNTIEVWNLNGERHLYINGNGSSKYTNDGRKYRYVEFIEHVAINPILNQGLPPKNILVLGAGAFTLGANDTHNQYDFVDIDESLKDIAEKHILKRPTGPNVTFHPMPARAYLAQTDKKYDVIVLDAYLGALTVPEHLITLEFFETVKSRLKPDGRMVANMALSPGFLTKISQRVDNTIRAVFPHVSRSVIRDDYGLWQDDPSDIENVMYMYRGHEDADSNTVYTDTKNTSFIDRPRHRE